MKFHGVFEFFLFVQCLSVNHFTITGNRRFTEACQIFVSMNDEKNLMWNFAREYLLIETEIPVSRSDAIVAETDKIGNRDLIKYRVLVHETVLHLSISIRMQLEQR